MQTLVRKSTTESKHDAVREDGVLVLSLALCYALFRLYLSGVTCGHIQLAYAASAGFKSPVYLGISSHRCVSSPRVVARTMTMSLDRQSR